jgi:hypothetical protein
MKTEGSGSASGSISQRHGSADQDPDPHQNVMDPQHWLHAPASASHNYNYFYTSHSSFNSRRGLFPFFPRCLGDQQEESLRVSG